MKNRKHWHIVAQLMLAASCVPQARADNLYLTMSSTQPAAALPGESIVKTTREVTVLSAKDLKDKSVNSVADIINLAPGAEAQSRAGHGIQSDISLRGSTYQQVLILIDGVRANDSQTAHYSMDLPLPLGDIERVEILHGQASSVYGPDALGGVVNIITKPIKDNSLEVKSKVSQHNTTFLSGSYGKRNGGFSQKISAEKSRSDGFRYDTDFDNLVLSSKSELQNKYGTTGLSLGFMDKDYGAYDFYTPGANYPSREQTKTYFGELGNRRDCAWGALSSKFFFRRHDDTFTLDQTRPSFYVNRHKTYYYGGEIRASVPIGGQNLLVGAEAVQDQILSTNLGDHTRPRQGIFGQLSGELAQDWFFDAALRADSSDWGTRLSPSLGLSYWPSLRWKLRTSAGMAFRAPSFTELYYHDPLNNGNPNLKPEEAMSYDIGADYMQGKSFSASITAFLRDQHDLIDWVGTSKTGPWTATNIGQVSIYGVESSATARLNDFSVTFGGSLTGSDKEADYISKYALTYPTAQGTLNISYSQPQGFTIGAGLVHRDRRNLSSYSLLSAKISWTRGSWELFADGSNLLNTGYEEIAGIPQPGRWLGIGANLRL